MVQMRFNISNHLGVAPKCDRRTDRRTDGRTDRQRRL